MSIGSRLIHTVSIQRASEGPLDEYHQPTQVFAEVGTVRALIQPKAGRERALVSEGGAVRGEYRGFLLPTDVSERDRLVRQDTGDIFQIEFVADAGGRGHHLELDLSKVS